jgi:hypothetical protein
VRVRRLAGALTLFAAASVWASDPRLDPARVEVFHDRTDIGDGEIAPKGPTPAYCVGKGGWVLVDGPVVADLVHVFVGVEGSGPFAARVRAVDEASGLALMSVHPTALAGRRCLAPFREGSAPKEAPLVAGTPVLDDAGRWVGVGAAGSSRATLGKLATGAWVGQEKRRRAIEVVPVAVVEELLARGGEGGVPPPEGSPFLASDAVYPRSLRERAAPPPDELPWYEAALEDGIRLQLLTPASLESLARFDDGAYAPFGEFFRWRDHEAMWEPAVVVQVAPEFHWTGGSKGAAVTATILFIPMVLGGGPPIVFRAAYTSGKERVAFRAERGGETFEPRESFVSCHDEPMLLQRKDAGEPELRRVRGCRAFALFDPQVFAPGGDVEVAVEDADGRVHCVPIAPPTLERVTADFEPWRAALHDDAPQAVPPRLRVLPYWEGMTVAVEDGAIFRFFFQDGSRIDVTRREHDGVTVLRVPVWRRHTAFWSRNTNPAGWLEVTAEAFVFTPLREDLREKGALRIPRLGTTATREAWGMLRLEREGGTWTFVPRFEGEPEDGLLVLPRRSDRVPVTDRILEALPPEKAVVEEP